MLFKWIICGCYYAFLACLQCVAQQAGICMLANYIRCGVVVTVIGVSFILKTDLTGKESKVSSLVDDCHSVATIHHIIYFSANVVLYTEILLAPPCTYLISQIVVLIYVRAHYLQSLTSH